MDYIAVAAAPGIAICLYIFYKDIYNREPKLNLLISFLLGVVAILPAIALENYLSQGLLDGTVMSVAIFAFLVVGLSEEFCKFVGLRLYSYNQKSFDEPLDGIVYSLMIGMGFATTENIMYAIKYEAVAGAGMDVAIKRMFLSVPAHATFAVVMGYYVGKAKFSPNRSLILMLKGLLGATFFHGAYDFFLFLNEFSLVGRQLGEGLLFGGAVASLIVALVLSRKLIREHHHLSRQTYLDNKANNSA
jgi:RsiW-degrading membrane proteinase PrsW (M82 family)